MNIPEEEIERVKAWKDKKRKVRQYFCPFSMSKIGSEICISAFKRCNYNPNKYPLVIFEQYIDWSISKPACFTSPCPCQIYGFQYVMRQANRIIKYGKI